MQDLQLPAILLTAMLMPEAQLPATVLAAM